MKKNLLITLLAFIGIASLSFTTSDDVVTLRLHPKKGANYTIKVKNSTMNVMDVMGQNMTVNQTMEAVQSFTVKEVNTDGCTIESMVESMKLTTKQMGMTFTYDSEHPEDTSPMIAAAVSGFTEELKKPVTLEYDALGNFVGDSVDFFMNQLGDVIFAFPEEELTVGSQWTREKSQTVSNIEITTVMVCTVTKISKKEVEISMNGHMNAEGEEMGTGSATYEGTAIVDPQTGLLKSSTMKSNVSITVTEQGMSIPVTSTGTTTITVE